MFLVLWLLLVLVGGVLAARDKPFSLLADRGWLMLIIVSVLVVGFPCQLGLLNWFSPALQAAINHRHQPSRTRKRVQRSFNSIFAEQGLHYVRRAHRMDADSSWNLHRIINLHFAKTRRRMKKHRDGARSRLITSCI